MPSNPNPRPPVYVGPTTELTSQQLVELVSSHYEWHKANVRNPYGSIYDGADSLQILLDDIVANNTASTSQVSPGYGS
jgi:hypothetical protein